MKKAPKQPKGKGVNGSKAFLTWIPMECREPLERMATANFRSMGRQLGFLVMEADRAEKAAAKAV